MQRRLDGKDLSSDEIMRLEELVKQTRKYIIEMTTLAGSGHPGGALGRAEMDVVLRYSAKIDQSNPFRKGSDIIIDSAGHYSAGTYAALAALGFIHEDDLCFFRALNSPLEGHVSYHVPSIWYKTGMLGQGLSAGVGFALSNHLLGHDDSFVFVQLGDGEQNKGQIGEALRFAKKYNDLLHSDYGHGLNLVAIVDDNGKQLSGDTDIIMPMNIKERTEANGWNVIINQDGNDIVSCFNSLNQAKSGSNLTLLLNKTIMGKGIPNREGDYLLHGSPLSKEAASKALENLGFEPRFEELEKKRNNIRFFSMMKNRNKLKGRSDIRIDVDSGGKKVRVYSEPFAPRKAMSNALLDVVRLNQDDTVKRTPIVLFDSDLEPTAIGSLGFMKEFPKYFFQCGIAEHNTASVAGALSLNGIIPVVSGFSVINVSEMYSQNRMNGLNGTNVKLFSTHNGLDVGMDGPTHQEISPGILDMNPEWQTFYPADANQADRIVRYALRNKGNMNIVVGRSALHIIHTKYLDNPFFDEDYVFEPGNLDILRQNYTGVSAVIFTYGTMVHKAVKVSDELFKTNIWVDVVNVPTPSSIDKEQVIKCVERCNYVVTYEDAFIGREGELDQGLGSKIKSCLYGNRHVPHVECLGLRGRAGSASPDQLYSNEGLHEVDLKRFLIEKFGRN